MVYHYDAECSYLPRGTYTDYGGMALYPLKQPSLNDRAQGCAPQRKRGGYMYTPRKYPTFDYYH